ncbi:MAG: polysaccharide biosynthesis protein [Marmoricola sp.]|jgi:lipopolysaccharide exporter|nr:polysaccharide biosynthesis protein [Marmoricola sp.]
MAWAGATLVMTKGVTLVSTLILARLLVPADFGLFAVGLLVINYIDRIKDFGVGAALVYRREDWTRLSGTGFSISVLSALVLAALTFAGAPLAGQFFDHRATGIIRALSLALLLSGLAVVPESRLRRELDFRRRAVPETSAAVIKGVVSVMLAYLGLGVWSLVWAQLAGTIVQTLLYWALCRWRPRFEWHPEHTRTLLRYGLPLAFLGGASAVIENLDYVVIGRLMEPSDLGYYVLAFRVPELSVTAVCVIAAQVFFPMFSRLQDDLVELRRAYLEAVRYVSLVTTPMAVLLATVAPELVPTLYSERWAPSIPLLRLLALSSLVYALSFHAGEIYKATGRPGILNTLAVVKVVVMLPALWVGAQHSIVAVCWGVLLANIVLTCWELAVVQRILRFSVRSLLGAFTPGLMASAVMAAANLALLAALARTAAPWRLAVACVLALPVYLMALHVLAPETSRAVWGVIRRHRLPVPADGDAW